VTKVRATTNTEISDSWRDSRHTYRLGAGPGRP
jgi:hypothetical protein